jgi:Skp family chaperone for outer membrane proteins
MAQYDDFSNGTSEQQGLVQAGDPEATALQSASEAPPDLHNLEKIREILFGSQVRTHDQRFSRIEERLEQECNTLRSDINRRLDALESYIQQEVSSLGEQIKETKQAHANDVEKLEQSQLSATKALEQKLSQLDEKTTESERSLRKQVLEQSNQLSADSIQRYNELLTIVEREVAILHAVDKTDRANLAAFFGEMSMRLQSD